MARIHQNLEGTTAALGQSMEFLNEKIDVIAARTDRKLHVTFNVRLLTCVTELLEFQSFKYAMSLRHIILTPDSENPDKEDLLSVSAQVKNFPLSPKDGWEENGILKHLFAWSSNNHDTLLWVMGRSGNQDPWITSFTLDMINAFRTQGVTLLYAFCNNTVTTQFLTPNTLLRRFISQLLDHCPRLAFQYPRLFNKYIFHSATNFDRLWSIFLRLVELAREIFIVIDRIEEVREDEDGLVEDRLIPELLKLASNENSSTRQEGARIGIVITSAQPAPPGISGDERLYEVQIDTGKRPKDRR